jgi:DNA-binding response OmpR family regulator
MYAMYLRAQGLVPVVMDDPDEAFGQAAQMDLIVTGIRLRAAADGLALIARLRQHDATRTKPIIVLTACAFDEDRARAIAAGCDVFLAKPCPPATLLAEVQRLIASSRELRVESLQQTLRGGLAVRAAEEIVKASAAQPPEADRPAAPPPDDPQT